ncbi:hypothetical protein F511_04979 [Dorcoceras hygrometricum]|uniref:Uncharacterized protein n=1 Tax=Dorcoceras hygrometricum TaxID=472368 RepID=A0A2Z7BYA5_9LAMI|nr:hypothetical protein F511_04979 [Dorcoceras hygrometricum]
MGHRLVLAFSSGDVSSCCRMVVSAVIERSAVLLFTEPYLLRLPVVGSSDEGKSGSIGLLLLRLFVWILFSNVCLKLVRCAKTSPLSTVHRPYLLRLPVVGSSDEGKSGSIGLLLLRLFVWILFSNVCLKLVSCCVAVEQVVDLRHCGNVLVVIVAQRFELLHLHTRMLLSSPVLLAMPVMLNCEYQDAMFKDERVVPVYLGGCAGNSRTSFSLLGLLAAISEVGFSAGRGCDPAGGAPGGVDWAVKMRIRPPEIETSICDAKYRVSLSQEIQAQRIVEVARRSSRSDESAAKQLTNYQRWMSTAELNSNGESDKKSAKEKDASTVLLLVLYRGALH